MSPFEGDCRPLSLLLLLRNRQERFQVCGDPFFNKVSKKSETTNANHLQNNTARKAKQKNMTTIPSQTTQNRNAQTNKKHNEHFHDN